MDCEGVLISCDFATFVYSGDAHRLHKLGQLDKQLSSNGYPFNQIIIVYQNCNPKNYEALWPDYSLTKVIINDIDDELDLFGINLSKSQYQSPTDNHHTWKQHVVNHLVAARMSSSDFIVFADNDCWMIKQPDSWVSLGIDILDQNHDIFMVSPNDGEPERKTQVMSQQMFLVRTEDFRQADWNQPGWDGNVHVPGGPFPEYWALLEGRMELYCRYVNRYRYVLPSEYRYWHFNKINPETNHFEMDLSKY